MTASALLSKLRDLASKPMPLPGGGDTAERLQRLVEIGKQDLSLARLAEAHFDAVAILAEAGKQPASGAIYGVWASELPGSELQFDTGGHGISGRKMFCTGAQLVDRALVTVGGAEPLLVDVDLKQHASFVRFDASDWQTAAFAETQTYTAYFEALPVDQVNIVGVPGWYLRRPGFWHGACGPAACWAGGALALVEYAQRQTRNDAHTLAHVGAMHALGWALDGYLKRAGDEIDLKPRNAGMACVRALRLRHLVEAASTEILHRIPRAFGPRPLAMDHAVSQRYHELDLYLRQSHAERDLEALGRLLLQLEHDA